MRRHWLGGAALLMGLVAANATAAQDATDDWDYGEDPARKLAVAAVTFETFGVAVRCVDGALGVVISGLPVASGERSLRYRMGAGEESASRWVSGRNSTTAFALWPRSVAAGMSRGGRLSIGAAEGERTRRYAVDLPASAQSIDKVFRACGQTLDPPAEEAAPSGENFAGFRWESAPEPSFPYGAQAESGLAALTCVVRDAGLIRDCRVESEFPVGSDFGRAATYGAHRTGRVAPLEGAASSGDGRRVSFIVRYGMSNDLLGGPPSRLPVRDPAPPARSE